MKNQQEKSLVLLSAIISAIVFILTQTAAAQTTAFNFQGRLNDGSSPANGKYDLEFRLYDALTGDNIVGTAVSKPNMTLINGVFSTQLDFGANAFDGADRFIEIRLRATGSGNSFTILGPRQQVLSVPYTIRSARSTTADNAAHAVNADNAINATNAVNAQNAEMAINANKLGGLLDNRYLSSDENGDFNFKDSKVAVNNKLIINGNAFQSIGGAGLPKALLQIDRDGRITRCYNPLTQVARVDDSCGFTVNHSSIGSYEINIGLQVNYLIINVTTELDYADTVSCIWKTSQSAFTVRVRYMEGTTHAGDPTNAPLNVVVF